MNQITTDKATVYFKILHYNAAKAGLCSKAKKKLLDVICYLYKRKQFDWLLCVGKNCDWSRKITALSNLT